jgi:quercetin dioxygenase-like cupin family protein
VIAPYVIDVERREWSNRINPKFSNAKVKVLYDSESRMKERVYYTLVEPGGNIGLHTHPTTEVLYVLSGNGVVIMGDQRVSEIHGKVFFIPPGIEHGVSNESKGQIELLSFAVAP